MNKYSGNVIVSYDYAETLKYVVEVFAEDEDHAITVARDSDEIFANAPIYEDARIVPENELYEIEDYELVEEDVTHDLTGNPIDDEGTIQKNQPEPFEPLPYDATDLMDRFGGKEVPDFLRRAQMTTKKRFIENLFNLKSSIADILRGDEQFLEADIKKLRNDARRLVRSDEAFEKLGTVDALSQLLDVNKEKFDNDIDKYKRLNNHYNKHIVAPIRNNIGLFGMQLDLSKLESKDLGSEITQPGTMKLSPEVPSYLKLKSIPEISDEPRSKSWHSKLDDVTEMLKVLGDLIPDIEDSLRFFKLAENDTTKIISLSDREDVNANIVQAEEFYRLAFHIASRMKTAKIMAARAGKIIYTLEELPKEYLLSPTQNREFKEILWHNYIQSGKVEHIVKRVQQMGKERSQLEKKFRQVFEQWSVLYEDTAKSVGVESLKPIQLQLVRYGQGIVSAETILQQMRELDSDLEAYNENLHALTTDLSRLYSDVIRSGKEKAVAQLRPVAEPAGRLTSPLAPVPALEDREVPQKPPKLPVGDEWLDLVFEEDKDLYYGKGSKLTPPQAIALAGRNGLKIAMQYQKASNTGDPEEAVVKNYLLEPYSYRVKTTQKRGRRKYLFAYDEVDASIKAFLVGNIRAVQILPDPYIDRWEVEFY